MAKTNRRTLKEYFSAGKKPDCSQFADLIDSMLNIVDDGFIKTADGGMTLSPTNGSREGNVMEIRQDILDSEAAWRFSVTDNGSFLICRGMSETPVVRLNQDGSVMVNPNTMASEQEQKALSVKGGMVATSYKGEILTVPADGLWHNITHYEYGCMAYRVVAKAKAEKGSGRYAMSEVSAMNCFGKHAKVKNLCRSWFGSKFNSIQFRWNAKKDEHGDYVYGLQMRSRSNYGDQHVISYYILEL